MAIYSIADTGGDETEWSLSPPTSWSLGDMLVFSCFIFFLVQPHMTSLSAWRSWLFPTSGPLQMLFSLPRTLCPQPRPLFFRESSPYPADDVSFFVLFLATCLPVPQAPVNSMRAFLLSYSPGSSIL